MRPRWAVACIERRTPVLFGRVNPCFLSSNAMKRANVQVGNLWSTSPAKERHHEAHIFFQSAPTHDDTKHCVRPHLVKWKARCGMPNGSRTVGAPISDHLLAPSRQLAMHGIVRKLDVPRRNWGGGVLYVGSPSRAGVCSNFATSSSK
jgi:hypothetical protein